jgi:hypothetical protein
VDYREEPGRTPKVVGIKADGAAGLEGQNSICSRFCFESLEQGKAVVSPLGVHCNAGLRNAAEFWLPLEFGS